MQAYVINARLQLLWRHWQCDVMSADPARAALLIESCCCCAVIPQVMREKLLYAIYNCQEMDGDFRLTDNEMTGWD